MDKNVRYVYEVAVNEIVEWNEETEFPECVVPILDLGDVAVSFMSAHPITAYMKYLKCIQDISEFDFDWKVDLERHAIMIDDDDWQQLLKKDSLEYTDYCEFLMKDNDRICSWKLDYRGHSDGYDDFVDEILLSQCEYYNMRAVCQRAGISYSTYRGFKNNKQPFSIEKTVALLRSMKSIGDLSWNNELEKEYQFVIKTR